MRRFVLRPDENGHDSSGESSSDSDDTFLTTATSHRSLMVFSGVPKAATKPKANSAGSGSASTNAACGSATGHRPKVEPNGSAKAKPTPKGRGRPPKVKVEDMSSDFDKHIADASTDVAALAAEVSKSMKFEEEHNLAKPGEKREFNKVPARSLAMRVCGLVWWAGGRVGGKSAVLGPAPGLPRHSRAQGEQGTGVRRGCSTPRPKTH